MLMLYAYVITGLAGLTLYDLFAAIQVRDSRVQREFIFRFIVNVVFAVVFTALIAAWL
jgi:hypothetical protein